MRLIDADALIRDLQERYCRPCKAAGLDYNGVKCKACQFDDEIDDIDGFADNSIDIVRCAECKHWERLNYEAPKEGWCDDEMPYSDGRWVDADAFCSYGEREGE